MSNYEFDNMWHHVGEEEPPTGYEVIVLDKDERISFAHIVDPDEALNFEGWNIPDVVFWRNPTYTEEMFDYYGYQELEEEND